MDERRTSSKREARVFISYRRADGQYAVGWIEERLRQIRHIGRVEVAFRDSDLEFGDDYPQRLLEQVEACKVLIAVIGPNWRGQGHTGGARILDPDDWVGREIQTALVGAKTDPDKLIIPVLMSGVEPLEPGDVLEEHRPFVDLHAVRFEDASSLERLAMRVQLHLQAVGRREALEAKLHEPIELPSERLPRLAWGGAAVAVGVLGALVGWLFVAVGRASDEDLSELRSYLTVVGVQTAVSAALFVLGVAYHRTVLSTRMKIDWRSAAITAMIALVLLAWAVVAFGASSDRLLGGAAATWLHAVLVLGLMAPWVIVMVAPGWARPRASDLATRAVVVAIERRGLRVAAPAVTAVLALSVVSTAELEPSGGASVIVFGVFVSLLTAVTVEYSNQKLVEESEKIVASVPPTLDAKYRANVTRLLVPNRRPLRTTVMWWALVPALAAVVVTWIGS